MDPLDFKTSEELLLFFHRKKTEISCIEKPHRLLTQLRDHDLVPEKLFENVKKVRSREQKEKGFYEILDWFEKNRPQDIHQFWRCVFKDHILQRYPMLRILKNNLLDGVYEKRENVEKGKEKSYKRKRSKDDRSSENSDDPGPSSANTPKWKKPNKKPSFCSKTNFGLVKKSGANGFQELEGKGGGTELRERVGDEDMADLSVFQAPSLPVTCGSRTGNLYKYRFASGSRGKCVRTEERWYTPKEFVKQELTLTDGHWKKDILCHGKTLNFLIKKKILHIHSLLCECVKCSTREQDMLTWVDDMKKLSEVTYGDIFNYFVLSGVNGAAIKMLNMDQNNDDECYVCRSKGRLVCCDECPRAFHSDCHLPAVHGDSSGEWICTFCVLEINQSWRDTTQNMSEQEVFNAPVSEYSLHCHYLLLCVYREDIQKVFVKDPRPTVPRYSEFITQPMWLDRIKQKLESGQYQTVQAFVSDFQLLFSNCSAFTRNNEFGRMGARLKQMFDEEFRKVFSISVN